MSMRCSLACYPAPVDSSQVCCLRNTNPEQGILHLQLVSAARDGLPAYVGCYFLRGSKFMLSLPRAVT